jgi:hypothetical protein
MSSPALQVALTIREQIVAYQPPNADALAELLSDGIQVVEATKEWLAALASFAEESPSLDPSLSEDLHDVVTAVEGARQRLEDTGDRFLRVHDFWLSH